jgi:sigma-E factor negative regulatory protein RseB
VLALLLVVLLVLLGLPAQPAAAQDWREVLERAAQAARSTAYTGEALVVTTEGDDRSHVARIQVASSGAGLTMGGDGEARLRLGVGGGTLDDGLGGEVALPPIEVGSRDDLRRLGAKYHVAVAEGDRVMDRPCSLLEITRRADGALRERLWIDDDTGLLVRRETFDGGAEPVRLAAYLSLSLDPERTGARAGRSTHVRLSGPAEPAPAEPPGRKVADAVDERERTALRSAGWIVPDALPEGYVPVGAWAVDAGDSQPLQLVYGDGLYVVSVFQEHGTPDWGSLPAGASRVEGLDFPAWEWPGAVPSRLLWEAEGQTFSLVGDAPPGELLMLAAALPRPQGPGLLTRLRRGLGRLWSAVTPW